MKKILITILALGVGPAWARPPQYVPMGGPAHLSNLSLKGPRVDVTYPAFGVGQPVESLTSSGSCTSAPMVTISAPQSSADGSQAIAKGYCLNGVVKAYITFPGGGYTSATCTVRGGGTNSPSCSVTLMGTAGLADPTGVSESSAAIQNAIDYAFNNPAASDTTASVYIPQGEYDLAHTLVVPCDERLFGDGPDATVLNLTDTSEDGIVIVNGQKHPDPWDCRGSLESLTVSASQGHNYAATQIAVYQATGYTLRDLTVSGGGGRGIKVTAERLFAQNIEIDTVRWPLIWDGNENHIVKLNIASPGASSDTVTEPSGATGDYCWSEGNCVNGEFPSYRWSGGTLEYASANGSTATFYVHSNGAYPTAPIIAGMHFTVTGTTGTSLDGLYTATRVTNDVNTDPSGKCSTSNVCFEVQAASTANGTAKLTPPSTMASFSSRSYTLTVASATALTPNEVVSGAGIPSGSRIQAVSGTTVTINNKTISAETSTALTGTVAWTPTIMPTMNSAVDFAGANVQVTDGSVKTLAYSNCFQDDSTFGSSLSNFYCEGYPMDGVPVIASTFRFIGDTPSTTLTASLSGSAGAQTQVGVESTLWFPDYVNNPAMLYGQGYGSNYGETLMVEPADFSYGSTAASTDVSGVEKGQYELIYGAFTANDKLVILSRNLSGSTAPANTTWPSGSIIAVNANKDGNSYGTLTVAHMHANAMAGGSANWSVDCDDQSSKGDVCGEFLLGGVVNETGAFTTGQAGAGAGAGGVSVLFVSDETWGILNQGTEALGQGFIKSVGRGASVGIVDTEARPSSNTGYGDEATTGQLYADGFVNALSYDGSPPYSSFVNLATGERWNSGMSQSINPISATSGNAPGSPVGSVIGKQFQDSYCWWDTSSSQEGHAQNRWCFLGQPGAGTPQLEQDHWTGTAWTTTWSLARQPAIRSSGNTFTAPDYFQSNTYFGGSGQPSFEVDRYGQVYWKNSSGVTRWFIRADGKFYLDGLWDTALNLQDSFKGATYSSITSSGPGRIDMNGSSHNDDSAAVYARSYNTPKGTGYSGTVNTSRSGCILTVSGGVITGASGC